MLKWFTVNEIKVMLCFTFKGCGYLNLCLVLSTEKMSTEKKCEPVFGSKALQVDNASSHPRPQSNEFLGAIVFIQLHSIFIIMASKDLNFGYNFNIWILLSVKMQQVLCLLCSHLPFVREFLKNYELCSLTPTNVFPSQAFQNSKGVPNSEKCSGKEDYNFNRIILCAFWGHWRILLVSFYNNFPFNTWFCTKKIRHQKHAVKGWLVILFPVFTSALSNISFLFQKNKTKQNKINARIIA